MSAEHASRLEPWMGCVLGCETGVALVRTDAGEVRATYGGRMLDRIARDRACAARAGDWVVLRRWPEGRVTIEDVCSDAREDATRPTGQVIPLRPR